MLQHTAKVEQSRSWSGQREAVLMPDGNANENRRRSLPARFPTIGCRAPPTLPTNDDCSGRGAAFTESKRDFRIYRVLQGKK